MTGQGDPAGLETVSPDPVEQEELARQTRTARARWLDPTWHREVRSWIDWELARTGRLVSGALEQPHLRPWSTTISVPTVEGTVWFKAGGPGNRYEASLLDALTVWHAAGILEPIAVDVERGWMLLPDGGPRLRDRTDGGPGVEHWLRILPTYAELQRGLAERATELIELGVPDRRPSVLPTEMAVLCEHPDVYLSPPNRSALRALAPTYASWCAALDAVGVPPSLQHDDLHDGNVFVGPAGDRIFDWGDASVAHPFGTLLVTLRSIASRGLGGPAVTQRVLDRLRDAYLEPWTAAHSVAELRSAVDLARRVAIVGRSMSWQRALSGIPMDDRGEWADAPGEWLMDLFEPSLV